MTSLSRITAGQMASQHPEDAENAPGGVHQMVNGQVVIHREEDSRFAIDAVRQVPVNFKVFGDGITERYEQSGQ
ncbi:hypothetical protein JZU56_00605 [bacterium]|nr:hypothetical protein [bacterium]